MEKYLIINADDYGYNQQQTEAVRELYTKGLITSTSVLTVTAGAKRAALNAAADGFPVGVHLTINSDDASSRWQSVSRTQSLNEKGKGLYCSQVSLALHAKRRDVAAEIEAQYAFLKSSGCIIDHADNHCGTLYGINGRRFYIDAFDFCARHSLPFRFPKTPGYIESLIERPAPRAIKAFQQHIVAVGTAKGVDMPDDLVSNPYSIERIQTYENLRDYYIEAVDSCIEGVTEMFLHPAHKIDDSFGGWTKRVFEYELLKSGDLLEQAEKRGIKTVSWAVFKELSGEKK